MPFYVEYALEAPHPNFFFSMMALTNLFGRICCTPILMKVNGYLTVI